MKKNAKKINCKINVSYFLLAFFATIVVTAAILIFISDTVFLLLFPVPIVAMIILSLMALGAANKVLIKLKRENSKWDEGVLNAILLGYSLVVYYAVLISLVVGIIYFFISLASGDIV